MLWLQNVVLLYCSLLGDFYYQKCLYIVIYSNEKDTLRKMETSSVQNIHLKDTQDIFMGIRNIQQQEAQYNVHYCVYVKFPYSLNSVSYIMSLVFYIIRNIVWYSMVLLPFMYIVLFQERRLRANSAWFSTYHWLVFVWFSYNIYHRHKFVWYW